MIRATMRFKLFLGVGMLAALLNPASGVAADLRLYVAGSLRQALPEIAAEYEKANHLHISIVIGQSSKLRQEIEKGKDPDIFASAAIEDTAALLKQGRLRSSEILARNELCLMAAPGIKLAPDKLIDLMTDPKVKLGTSTPNADPAGDYAWELFRKIDKVRPGTFAILDAKALKLLSPRIRRNDTGLPFPEFFQQRKADVFVTYCSNAVATARALPGVTFERFPELLNVAAIYGIGVLAKAPPAADAFVSFAVGIKGRRIFARYGLR